MTQRVLVTGAAGFVGSHLVALLGAEQPAPHVVGWRRPNPDGDKARRPASDSPARRSLRAVDVLDADAVHRAVEELEPDQVYHCAGAAAVAGSWNARVSTLRTNVIGTEHLLAAIERAAPSARVLIPGSALVYRPGRGALAEDADIGPASPYGLSKLAQEMLAARYAAEGLGVIRTRSFTHIGPGQNPSYAASSFARQIARVEAGLAEPALRVGDLDPRRDLLDVRDTVRAYRDLMERGTPGAVYNVCSGTAHPMREVLDRLVSLTAIPIEVRVDPARLRPSDYPVLCGDRTRITADVGWAPRIPLSETLRDLLDHWRAAVG
ncbi:MAG: NAD-dependent epimerase/dehydratase family protein [Acidobacteria bacterium]|nr:NAD-dependent epimerase/dehydratase family protein [Acidobacteriota bacterium]